MSSTRTLAAQLYHQLWLEVENTKQDMEYGTAISFCHDCPRRNWEDYAPQCYSEMEFGVSIAETCCKEDEDYHEIERQHIAVCEKIMHALKDFAGDDELKQAQAKVSGI